MNADGDSNGAYTSWLSRLRGSGMPQERQPVHPSSDEATATAGPPKGWEFVAAEDPRSPAAEQYRLMAARLEGVRGRHELRSVAVTSTMPGEGKTVTSVNLAYVLARDFGRRVLLVDGDLKKPSVWRYVGPSPSPGLCELIANRQPLEAVVHPFRHEQLDVLEAGLLAFNPTRVWKSALTKELFAQLTRRYDYLIVDTPPVLTVVDTTLIADLVDGVAVVVRSEMTPKAALQKALGSLPRAKIVGLVFNGVRVSQSPYYFQYP